MLKVGTKQLNIMYGLLAYTETQGGLTNKTNHSEAAIQTLALGGARIGPTRVSLLLMLT
jgi:hypothetical protein